MMLRCSYTVVKITRNAAHSAPESLLNKALYIHALTPQIYVRACIWKGL